MVYLKTNSNGGSTEGLGALVQYQLYCYALAKMHGFGFLFDGFRNLHHWQHTGVSQEVFGMDSTKLFNFKSDPVEENLPCTYIRDVRDLSSLKGDQIAILDWCAFVCMNDAGLLTRIKEGRFLDQVKAGLNFDKSDMYFDSGVINIAIHIRRVTSTATDNAPNRENYDISKKGFYTNLISRISDALKGCSSKIHIYSQGIPSDYDFLMALFPNIVLHVEEYPVISMYHMIHADVLVLANSSFGYAAHLLGDAVTLVRSNFYHRTYKSILVESSGDFDQHQLTQRSVVGNI
jgi:hypothetical protein